MKNRFSTEALIKKLKTNAFILNSSMPMGYVPNLPILCILNGNLCMKIPFALQKELMDKYCHDNDLNYDTWRRLTEQNENSPSP